MPESCVVLVTCSSEDEAQRIADLLVTSRTAACVNILSGVRSVYWWENKVEKSQEVVMLVKTQQKLVDEVSELVRKNHSYACPEIIAFPIQQGSSSYLNWIEENTRA